MKNNLLALSIFGLGLCFVLGCWLISDSLRDKETDSNVETEHPLLTKSEVADYLGISEAEVQKLTNLYNEYDVEGSYTIELPHIKIDKSYYYPKMAIDTWLLSVELPTVP